MNHNTFDSMVSKLEEKCQGMSEEQYGLLAGRMLLQGGISRNTLHGMLLAFKDEDDLWEMSEQIPELVNERMAELEADDADHDEGEEDDVA